ncbi:MAG: decarboxylase [Pseudomonadota bacterium]
MHRRYSAQPSKADFFGRDSDLANRLPRFRVDPDEAHAAALFLGPRAENQEMFTRMIVEAIEAVARYRQGYLPGDPVAITPDVQASPEFTRAVERLEENFSDLLVKLNEHATPYFASRYQGHMLWDTLLPGMLGYFATMLHNPNNVTVQASTLTTFLELLVGWDLCTMFGFTFDGPHPWGHITADGSVANLEATWSARELKFLPLAAKSALQDNDHTDALGKALADIAGDVEIQTLDGTARLLDADQWQLVNIPMAEALSLPSQIVERVGGDFKVSEVWERLLTSSVSLLGLIDFYRRCMGEVRHQPVILAPSTKHYSWPKALAVTCSGSGDRQIVDIAVDADARMNVDSLRVELEKSLALRRPILLTVSVMGSTEEGACDPLADVLQLREDFRTKGLDFNVHADAAWGGYFASVLRKDFAEPGEGADDPFIADQSHVHLSRHTRANLSAIKDADSVTVDPHKMGYIQYPAGALCYADERMRNLVTFGALVIGSPGSQISVGEFGIEGSKPGAAPAAVYLAHSVLRPSTSGYGQLINEALRSIKAFYIRAFTLASPDDPFTCVPLVRLPNERDGNPSDTGWARRIERMASMEIDEILADPDLRREFNEIGPDQNLVDYAFNFRHADGSVNSDIDAFNALNQRVYGAFHVHEGKMRGSKIDFGKDVQDYPLIITQTQMSVGDYGETFMRDYALCLGLKAPAEGVDFTLYVNRTVVMDPWLTHIDRDRRPFLDLVFDLLAKEAAKQAKKARSSSQAASRQAG